MSSTSATFFSTESYAPRIVGSLALFVIGGSAGIGGFVCANLERIRDANILTNCCQTVTQNATLACVKLVGELAYDVDGLAKLCDKMPDKRNDSTYHTALFGLIAAVSMLAGGFFLASSIYQCRRRSTYSQLV